MSSKDKKNIKNYFKLDSNLHLDPIEKSRRRRELIMLIPLVILFLGLTWLEFRLVSYSQTLPFIHSIFFFGLVNFNIIILLLLVFLIFRNLVKVFVEKQSGVVGSTLKGKLVASFVAFSTVPTILMFIISVFYINSSFDKWFNEKISGVLKSALEVTNAYVLTSKKKNYHFAYQIAKEISQVGNSNQIEKKLKTLRSHYRLDAVEYYPEVFGLRYFSISDEDSIYELPRASMDFLQKGLVEKHEGSSIHHFADGNLVRVIVPVPENKGAIVVSSYIPLSLLSKMDDILGAYEDFRDLNPIEYPIKSIYIVILVLMTLVIILAATWLGFYLAKQLSVPLQELGEATKRLSKGDYKLVQTTTGSAEISNLIDSFNSMTRQIEKSESEVLEANKTLKDALEKLDEHSKYIEVVLSNASTGVISVNQNGEVTMINRHGSDLLGIDAEKIVGKKVNEILSIEYYQIFEDLLRSMKKHSASNIKKEVRLTVKNKSIPLQLTLSILYDDRKNELGKVLVFDDLTPVLSAQRAAAWTEVARRIAHEIKNPLTPIKLAAQRLNKKFSGQIEDPIFKESIEMIVDQVEDMKNLVNEFSQFARMPKAVLVMSDLNEILLDVLALYKNSELGSRINCQLQQNFPKFLFDPDQMKRAITNIIENSISATNLLTHPKIEIVTEYDESLRLARLSISDNGEGISKGLRDRIFEPYVTTKSHGTGLGLAIVKKTIEDHNGFIRALPNSPRGTKMVIELPVVLSSSNKDMISRDLKSKGTEL